MKVLDINDSTS